MIKDINEQINRTNTKNKFIGFFNKIIVWTLIAEYAIIVAIPVLIIELGKWVGKKLKRKK